MSKKHRLGPILASVLFAVFALRTYAVDELTPLFHNSCVISVTGYMSYSNPVYDFPLKIVLSAEKVKGFSYDDCAADGSDLRFWFETRTNNATVVVGEYLNYKIETWDPDGESVLWVNPPWLDDNGYLKVILHWAPKDGAVLPANDPSGINTELTEEQLSGPEAPRYRDNWEAQQGNGFITYRDSRRDGKYLNYWLRSPFISKSNWRAGEKPAQVSQGTPAGGETVLSFFSLTDTNIPLPAMPTVAGNYRMTVEVAETYDYTPLFYYTNFTITAGIEIGKPASANDFAYYSELTVTGNVGSATLKDFPLLVRLRPGSPDGFTYASFPYGAETADDAYGDLSFFDASGRVLSYEIDTWNPEGESLIWVKVPLMTTGAKLKMAWGRAYGTRPLKNKPSAVWSDYVTVLHFNEEINAAQAPTAHSVDASDHGFDAVPASYNTSPTHLEDAVSVEEGVFGRARRNRAEATAGGGNVNNRSARFEIPASTNLTLSSTFVVSGWFREDHDLSRWTLGPAVVSRQSTVRLNNKICAETNGWFVGLKPPQTPAAVFAQGAGSQEELYSSLDSALNVNATADSKRIDQAGWVFFSAAYEGSNLRLAAGSGEFFAVEERDIFPAEDNREVISIGAFSPSTDLLSLSGAFDEIRIRRGEVTRAWQQAEFAQARGEGLVFNGYMIHDTSKLLENRWVRRPSLSKTNWSPYEEPAEVDVGETLGDDLSIHVRVRYQNRTTGEISPFDAPLPTELGEYRAIFTFPGNHLWSFLEETVDFRIVIERPIHDYGQAADGRTLLANDDYSMPGGEVVSQGYDDVEEGWGFPYWKHLDAEGNPDGSSETDATSLSPLYNLFGATHHELWEDGADGEKLWGLMDVRMGNTFANRRYHPSDRGTQNLPARQNFLAWNPLSQRMLSYSGLPVGESRGWAGVFLMRNAQNASINSKLFDDGIGTIYFDAVNGFADNVTNDFGELNYELVVEVATNWCYREGGIRYEGYGPPTDEKIAAEGVYSPYYYADFQPVTMHVYRFHGETCEEFETTRLKLEETAGGSVTNFYRVRARVNSEVPARFRIRRVAIDPRYTANPDGDAFILVDNVICSKPPDRVLLLPYGHYDPTKRVHRTVGQEGAFEPPYPGLGDLIVPRVKAELPDGSKPEPGRVTAATMHYRWHYIEQQETDWELVDFDVTTLHSRSGEPLLMPFSEGDIEFWFEGTQNGGYYSYADYSGLGLGVPRYSEAIPAMTNRMSEAENWFVRIREGSSDLSEINLEVRQLNSYLTEGESLTYVTNVYPMTLIADNTWRVFMPTNAINEFTRFAYEPTPVWYRFVLKNRQVSGAEEYAWNTNYLYSSEKIDEFPRALQTYDGEEDSWGELWPEDVTGYFLFKLNELNHGLVIAHADYQNFNGWTDAHGEVFIGTGIPDGARPSGASGKKQFYDWPTVRLADTPETDDDWMLTCDEPDGSLGGIGTNVTFKFDTRHTFNPRYAKYVCGAYDDPRTGLALSLTGQGLGSVEKSIFFPPWPSGIGTVSFTARLAQEPDFNAFATYGPGWGLKENTFYARAAFDLRKCQGFTGKASLSMVGMYRYGVGCYEARIEQTVGNVETNHGIVIHGPSLTNKTCSIYKWVPQNGAMVPQLLGRSEITDRLPTTDSAEKDLLGLKLVANSSGGVSLYVTTVGITTEARDPAGYAWTQAVSASDPNPLKGGSFGLLSSGCEGIFLRPQAELSVVDEYGSNVTRVVELDDPDLWAGGVGREIFTNNWNDTYGFIYDPPDQAVRLMLAPMPGNLQSLDATVWDDPEQVIATNVIHITNFGVIDASINEWAHESALFNRTVDCAVRIETLGTLDGPRTDVVLDNIKITQWAGVDSDNFSPNVPSQPDEFAYTSAWVVDGAIQLAARRTKPEYPASIRTPLCDARKNGSTGVVRGEGLGMIGFSYRNVHPSIQLPDEPLVLVQVCTNASTGVSYNYATYPSDRTNAYTWVTWASFTAADLGSEGATNVYFGLHGASGMARIVLNQDLVRNANAETNLDANISAWDFGSIDILEVSFQDEPSLDKHCWWGFNMRTIGDGDDSENRMYLPDWPRQPPRTKEWGLGASGALNNSVYDQIDIDAQREYFAHMPFIQTPTMKENVIGELTFRARMYDTYDSAAPGKIALYGITGAKYKDFNQDSQWELIETFTTADATYKYFSYKLDADSGYIAFRLAVTGIPDVTFPGPARDDGYPVARVLLDEICVCERVQPRLGIRNVGAFRSDMTGSRVVPNVPSRAEQPLCEEGWGVQCELYTMTMADEVDFTRPPEVKLHWFVGDWPWGFENWKNLKDARVAKMEPAAGTNLIYRSSYLTCPEAVIEPALYGGTIVQYMLEVTFYTFDPETGKSSPSTMFMSIPDGDWRRPDWYAPLDFNHDPLYGNGESFAAYCILDTVAPGWAWINEVNIQANYETYDPDVEEGDRDTYCQYIEVAAPMEASLEGWSLELVNQTSSIGEFVTNTIAVFGENDLGTTKDTIYQGSNMLFYVVANTLSQKETEASDRYERTLTRTDGTYDGPWTIDEERCNSSWFYTDFLPPDYPFGIQLRRPSGIIEQQIFVCGTNTMAAWLGSEYSTDMQVNLINKDKGNHFFNAGDDNNGLTNSLSVLTNSGEKAACWFNNVGKTPGRINIGQYIDPDHPTPNGESVIIFASVDRDFGHIYQKCGLVDEYTNATQIIVVRKGNETGTNILYQTDRFYELGSVVGTTNNVSIEYYDGHDPFAERTWRVNVGRGAYKNINLLASARIEKRLRDLGIDENNRYSPAVINWLESGTTANPYLADPSFENPTGEIHLAYFRDHNDHSSMTNLTLTEMYWLDIDPTASTNMIYEAGFEKQEGSASVKPVVVYDPFASNQPVTNIQMTTFMMITNDTDNVESKYYQQSWPPYITRGLDYHYTSWDYERDGKQGTWNSVNFKIRGVLLNEITSTNFWSDNWVPLRWFVFSTNSFYTVEDELADITHARYTADIEVADPLYSPSSPGYNLGWHDWAEKNGYTPIFYGWALDGNFMNFEIEVLNKNSYFDWEPVPPPEPALIP